MTAREALRQLGIGHNDFHALLRNGEIEAPLRRAGGWFFEWTDAYMKAIRPAVESYKKRKRRPPKIPA